MDTDAFYHSTAWHHKRAEILARDHYECVLCKEGKGYKPGRRHTRAVIVHHVQHLREHPDLALADTYTDGQGVQHRQLISVCRACHELVCHPDRRNISREKNRNRFVNEERW